MRSSGSPEHLNLEQHRCENLNSHRWHVPGGRRGQNLKFTSTQNTILIGEKFIQIQLSPSPSYGNPRSWQLYRRVLVGPLCLKWGMFKHLQSFLWLGKRTHLVMWRQTLDVIGQPNLYHVECLRHNFAVTWCLDAILAVFGVRVSDVVDKQKLLVVFYYHPLYHVKFELYPSHSKGTWWWSSAIVVQNSRYYLLAYVFISEVLWDISGRQCCLVPFGIKEEMAGGQTAV